MILSFFDDMALIIGWDYEPTLFDYDVSVREIHYFSTIFHLFDYISLFGN